MSSEDLAFSLLKLTERENLCANRKGVESLMMILCLAAAAVTTAAAEEGNFPLPRLLLDDLSRGPQRRQRLSAPASAVVQLQTDERI